MVVAVSKVPLFGWWGRKSKREESGRGDSPMSTKEIFKHFQELRVRSGGRLGDWELIEHSKHVDVNLTEPCGDHGPLTLSTHMKHTELLLKINSQCNDGPLVHQIQVQLRDVNVWLDMKLPIGRRRGGGGRRSLRGILFVQFLLIEIGRVLRGGEEHDDHLREGERGQERERWRGTERSPHLIKRKRSDCKVSGGLVHDSFIQIIDSLCLMDTLAIILRAVTVKKRRDRERGGSPEGTSDLQNWWAVSNNLPSPALTALARYIDQTVRSSFVVVISKRWGRKEREAEGERGLTW
jgi:hypothetical protein